MTKTGASRLDRRDRPKVLHVTTIDMSLEVLLGPQLRAFTAAGYEVVGASAPGRYVDQLEADGIRHIPLRHATRSMAPIQDLRFFAEFMRVCRAERPDIVHTHTPKPGWFGRPAARLARVPHVVNTVHGLYATPDDSAPKRAVVYALERFAAAFSDAELLQSSEDVPVLRRLRVPRSRIEVLGNGIDLDRFDPHTVPTAGRERLRGELGVGADDVLVGAVGRLVWEKGLAELLEAARILRKERPEVRMVVVGPTEEDKRDGLRESDLAAITEETGVVFAGARRDVESVYGAFDLYVLASHREGFPRSAMEAAAMGLPVIATDIRGCRHVVDDGDNGLLVPVRDGAALARAIDALAGDPDRRTAMSAAARRKAASDFDQQRVIERTIACYERLLAREGSRHAA